MKTSQIDAQSTSHLSAYTPNKIHKLNEDKDPRIVDKILDARLVDNELEFLCSVRNKSKSLWISRKQCKAGHLIQEYFDNRTRQFLIDKKQRDKKCVFPDFRTEKPSSSSELTTNEASTSENKTHNLKYGVSPSVVLTEEGGHLIPSDEDEEIECLSVKGTGKGLTYTFKSPKSNQQMDVNTNLLERLSNKINLQEALSFTTNQVYDAQLEFKRTGVVLRPSDQQPQLFAEKEAYINDKEQSDQMNGTIEFQFDTEIAKLSNGINEKSHLVEIREAEAKLDAIKAESIKDESFRKRHEIQLKALEMELEKRKSQLNPNPSLPKKRGRKPKSAFDSGSLSSDISLPTISSDRTLFPSNMISRFASNSRKLKFKKRRGRIPNALKLLNGASNGTSIPKIPRKPGRPRIRPLITDEIPLRLSPASSVIDTEMSSKQDVTIKRKPGRPRKIQPTVSTI